MSAKEIAAALTPLQADALRMCCLRGSTRGNDGGLVDDVISGLCSKSDEGIVNGWLVTWSQNPDSWHDGYINKYAPTPLGVEVNAIRQGQGA